MNRTLSALLPLVLAIGIPAQDKPAAKEAADTKATPPRYDAGLTCVHQVIDLDKAIAFYTDVLGFELLYKIPEMGWCELQTPVPEVNVGLARQDKVTPGGGATLTFRVLDLDESVARLRKAGVKTAEIETIPDLVRLLKFADLDGNALQLYQPLGKQPKQTEGFEAVRFLAGSWRGKHQGGGVEEHWMDADGGTMVGMSRTVNGAGRTFFEYLRIDKTKDGLVYQASPGGKKPVPFKLVESGTRKVVFENLEHDFPQRIRYWLDEAGNLRARVEDQDGKKGEDFVFQRAGLKAKG